VICRVRRPRQPEFGWDDFKGVEREGQSHRPCSTMIRPSEDEHLFGGKGHDLLRPMDLTSSRRPRSWARRPVSSCTLTETRGLVPGRSVPSSWTGEAVRPY
jgi:hypothetical protein